MNIPLGLITALHLFGGLLITGGFILSLLICLNVCIMILNGTVDEDAKGAN